MAPKVNCPDGIAYRGTLGTLYPGEEALWSPEPVPAYRYFLRRPPWRSLEPNPEAPPIAFLLLNPSTADEVQDDPTIRRCRGYAADWGYGEVMILNAFAFRATDPKVMRAQADPVGPDNDRVILETCEALFSMGGTLVCGWGNHGAFQDRGQAVRALLKGFPAQAFPLTGAGEPGHPLYLRKDVQLLDLNHD